MRLHLLLLFCALCSMVLAQKEVTVNGEYTYYAPDDVTPEKARRIAIERAKAQALEEAFGIKIVQNNSTIVSNSNDNSDVKFHSVNESDVRGEWLETIKENVKPIRNDEGQLVIHVSIKGKARQVVVSQIDFSAKALRNGLEEKFEDTNLKNGDELFLHFRSPVDGYVVVYLLDENEDKVYCLLPYKDYPHGSYKVKGDNTYVFFSPEKETEAPATVDEYVMTCGDATEYNTLYVIFSTHYLCKPVAEESADFLPKVLPHKEFLKWLTRQRYRDNTLSYKTISLSISK